VLEGRRRVRVTWRGEGERRAGRWRRYDVEVIWGEVAIEVSRDGISQDQIGVT